MNILLTGGTGYIGSHAAAVLAQQGHRVVLFDNLSNSDAAVVGQLDRILGAPPVFVQGDVRDGPLLDRTLRDHAIEAVIHFAGLKSVSESVERPLAYFSSNVQGALCLLRAMRDGGVRTLVFSSSATVYGEPRRLPLDESHPTGATNPYGRSKLHVEEILADLAASDPSWRVACLRYFNPVGAHDSGLIGENPRGVPNNLMPYVAQVAAGLRTELNVFGGDYPTPDGTGVRDYIHVVDLAEGHAAALGFLAGHAGWHAFNLGTGRGHSVLEIVRAFERASGRAVPYRIQARRPGDVAACYADPAKAGRDLRWTAARTLEDMCLSTWRYQRGLGAAPSSQ
ncbi:UDP-glucose 4-epimerase [Castellaniella defragrans 65Phen]|uniref:UDP-glucose 4-epimerase n=1 Tax=Castellaniella defragrans (strain DSM 12143 / CCUG 39792 / 65Phen) TaxID=1437824 RepID=W8WS57_CASD6|nr:UDP-glucose 4-epimerase GalE [Castellaniella defragrans]CDM22513.1 UDP-glucose 4-epimerase [Castellaniella defragrans 65Phen]